MGLFSIGKKQKTDANEVKFSPVEEVSSDFKEARENRRKKLEDAEFAYSIAKMYDKLENEDSRRQFLVQFIESQGDTKSKLQRAMLALDVMGKTNPELMRLWSQVRGANRLLGDITGKRGFEQDVIEDKRDAKDKSG